MKQLLTVAEAAMLLRLSKSKMYQLVENRRIPHYRLDGRILFAEDHLEEYLRQHVVRVTT